RGNTIHRITPRQNDEVNTCWMPDSPRLNFHYIVSAARLTEPLVKTPTGHTPAPWSDALQTAAEQLKAVDPEPTVIIASGRMTNEELFLARALAAEIGVTQLTLVPRTGEADNLLVAADRNPNTIGAQLVLDTTDPHAHLDAIREGVRSG